ncbi:hypothetical protein [Novosphingobium kaempferiae]|uniref:hypothetical protein n=1 Tax=Novosphingobium kaempferiae TaxID=2896849 RepID=UPI001E3F5FEA|nr:hypothetical protein [Novosphingobium kaempferiae]
MLNIATLTDDLQRALGDHAEIECEIDNVQIYLDAVAARRKIAPDVTECGWLMLLALYRCQGVSSMSASQACAASCYPATTALDQISVLMKQALIQRAGSLENRHVDLVLTPKGIRAVTGWLALMQLGARRPVEIATGSIVSALRTLPGRDPA